MGDEVVDNTEMDDEIIDISKLVDIKSQKECCMAMIETVLEEEVRLRTRFLSSQTVYDIVDADSELKTEMSEYLGYHLGSVNESMNNIDMAIINLKRFADGYLDEVEHDARGMYIGVWYGMAISGIVSTDISVEGLEKLEIDMIEHAMNESSDIEKGTIH